MRPPSGRQEHARGNSTDLTLADCKFRQGNVVACSFPSKIWGVIHQMPCIRSPPRNSEDMRAD